MRNTEKVALRNSVPKRKLEFAAGRQLARDALQTLGLPPVDIPVGPHRLPVWPDKIAGSISHTDSHVAAAVCSLHQYGGIGIDIEKHGSLDTGLVESVMTRDERQRYVGGTVDPTIFFSCKEAVYKAVFPHHREFLEFQDVTIDCLGDRFSATCSVKKRSAEWIARGVGAIAHASGHVVTLFMI